MSTTRRSPGVGGVVGHFVRTRGLEVAVLQASPLLGAWLAGLRTDAAGLTDLAILLAGSSTLTAHVFVLNDWAGYETDALDPRREDLDPAGRGITRSHVGVLALVLLLAATAMLTILGTAAVVTGALIAALSLVYSRSRRFGKATPVTASLNHLVGGSAHFLMGYATVRSPDADGVLLSLVFGLVFAAGHLNQEVRDVASDRASGIRTSAVAFGARRAFQASFVLFTVAYGLIVSITVAGGLPTIMLAAAGVWAVQAVWSIRALLGGLDGEVAVWMQRRYRLLFGLVGLLLLLR